MLPALTITRRHAPPRRVVAGALAFVFGVAGIVSSLGATSAPAPPAALADALRPATWAMTIPTAWLVAPAPRLRVGDALDMLAVRPGYRAYTVPVAYAVTVVSFDERGLVLQVDQDDAIALANARGGGMLLIPLLRSTR